MKNNGFESAPMEKGPKNWSEEAQNVIAAYEENNKGISKSDRGILGHNLLAEVYRAIMKEENTGPANEAREFAQQLAIALDMRTDLEIDEVRKFIDENYLHPENMEQAA